jgi:hypothetical protein
MVTRKMKTVRTRRTRRVMASPLPELTPMARKVRPVTVADIRAKFNVAGRRLEVAGQAATKFARSSMREMTTAARASREPMQALWHTLRLAGRHIARNAVAAWEEVAPALGGLMKLPVARARRPAA